MALQALIGSSIYSDLQGPPNNSESVSTDPPSSTSKTVPGIREPGTSPNASVHDQRIEVSYLQGMEIDAELSFSTPNAGVVRAIPQWAGFLMWLGWWLRISARQDRRVFAVVVAPARNSAALLAAFGAQLAGAQLGNALDWLALTRLSRGTEVFIQQKKNRNKSGGTQMRGVVEGVTTLKEYGGQEFVVIKEKGGTHHHLSVNHLHQFTVTLTSVGGRTKTAIHRHGALFRHLIPEFDQNWFVTPSTECVIAGEVASLRREGQRLMAGASAGGPFFSISKILGIDSGPGEAHAKAALIPPRHLVDQLLPSPLCILDGAAAFRSLEHCLAVTGANTTLAILDRVEFDEQFRQRVLTWIEGSHTELLPDRGTVSPALPAGLECSIAAIPLSA